MYTAVRGSVGLGSSWSLKSTVRFFSVPITTSTYKCKQFYIYKTMNTHIHILAIRKWASVHITQIYSHTHRGKSLLRYFHYLSSPACPVVWPRWRFWQVLPLSVWYFCAPAWSILLITRKCKPKHWSSLSVCKRPMKNFRTHLSLLEIDLSLAGLIHMHSYQKIPEVYRRVVQNSLSFL